MDGVAGNEAEGGAKAADDAGLPAVGDDVVADDVVADVFLGPAVARGPAGWSGRSPRPTSERLSHSSPYLPSAMPEHTEWLTSLFSMIQPLLQWVPIRPICSAVGGAQGVAAFRSDEAADGDVVHARLGRIEDRLADVDLHRLLIGIDARKLCPDGRVPALHLCEPERGGRRSGGSGGDAMTDHLLLVARSPRPFSQNVFQPGRLGEPPAAQVDGAGVVLPPLGIEPIAVDQIAVGIEAAEERIGDRHLPGVVPERLPVPDLLRSGDLDLFAGRGLVDDALGIGLAPRGGLTRSR